MKKTYFILLGLLLLVITFLIAMKLVGYSFNKQFLTYNRQQCIDAEYPTYYHHSGIAGCVFWMRNDYLEKTQSWGSLFKRDDTYCKQKYESDVLTSFSAKLDNTLKESRDPKCDYEGIRQQKRNENWDYLTSKQKDGFYNYCAEQSCPKQSMFK